MNAQLDVPVRPGTSFTRSPVLALANQSPSLALPCDEPLASDFPNFSNSIIGSQL